jgi:hypothetical protein
MIGLPKYNAQAFTAEHNLNADPAGALKDLNEMVQHKEAESVENFSVTSRNGQHGVSRNEDAKLQVESTWDSLPDDMIEVNIAFDYKDCSLTTGITVRSGAVRFLGTFDSSKDGDANTYLVFVVVRGSIPMPFLADMYEVTVSLNKNPKLFHPQPDWLPIIATFKNKTTGYARVSTSDGFCDMAIYSVGEDGKRTFVTSTEAESNFGGDPNELNALVEVEPGQSRDFESAIPLNAFEKGSKAIFVMIVYGIDWEPAYRPTSKPFSISDLKDGSPDQLNMPATRP